MGTEREIGEVHEGRGVEGKMERGKIRAEQGREEGDRQTE